MFPVESRKLNVESPPSMEWASSSGKLTQSSAAMVVSILYLMIHDVVLVDSYSVVPASDGRNNTVRVGV